MSEDSVYQFGGIKDARQLQWVTEVILQNGAPVLSTNTNLSTVHNGILMKGMHMHRIQIVAHYFQVVWICI